MWFALTVFVWIVQSERWRAKAHLQKDSALMKLLRFVLRLVAACLQRLSGRRPHGVAVSWEPTPSVVILKI
jgi:hypothetical protein